jgi:cytochrome c-type biogenesis protein CcmE
VTDTVDRAAPLDLTPREPKRPRSGRRRYAPIVLIALVVVAIGALLFKTLGDASLFFKNADEAVATRQQLGDKRFQLQGTVVQNSVVDSELEGRPAVLFSIAYNGVALDVVHIGNPPELFKAGEPVVLEGRWTHGASPAGTFKQGVNDGWYFASDRMLAKHDSNYESVNKARLREAEEGGKVPVTTSADGR